MRVLIFGCGRTGAALARMMSRRGHDVTVLERDPQNLARLGDDHGCTTVVGDGLDDEVLRNAGIENCDAFVTCTRGDNTNLMAAQIAQKRYNVQMVCAKVNDPQRAHEYNKIGVFCIVPNLLTAGMMRCWLTGEEYGPIESFNRLEDA
jgi:trk system potassium uptake protein TrkA